MALLEKLLLNHNDKPADIECHLAAAHVLYEWARR